MLQESGFIQDQKSRTVLEDKEATGYPDLKVSGDEESKIEDNYSDSEVGKAVKGLEEGWDQDE